MTMQIKFGRTASLAAGLLLLGAAFVWAQTEAEMEAWVKAMTPGKYHAHLAQLEGDWRYSLKWWSDPAAEPLESAGTCKKTMIFGGRYLQEEFNGDFMGQPFHGLGITGYDNTSGQFVSTWIDNAGTGILFSSGQSDASGKVQTFHSDHLNPVTLQTDKLRFVTRLVDANRHVFESYVTSTGADEHLQMWIEYVRESANP